MGERWKHWLLPWYSRRADQIQDPVARLRYLRKLSSQPEHVLLPSRVPWERIAATVLVLFTVGFLFFRTGSSARAISKGGAASGASSPRMAPRATREYVLAPLTANETKVWLVERKAGEEVYSNGLRVETADTAPNTPRQDQFIEVEGARYVTGSSKPMGIVFHTTESLIEGFEEGNNQRLRKVGRWLTEFVARNHFYHYLIDRFGRVHRVVPEQDVAHHAGRSVWADASRTYVDLNASFLAISLESETQPGEEMSDSVTPAQVHALRTLVNMLRLKYTIAEENCVTHAQVSVSADNFLIGDHTDFAANFPFGEVGLPDNYLRPSPAILHFGFEYDDDYKRSTGARMWRGLDATDKLFAARATQEKRTVGQHRQILKRHYRAALDAVKAQNADQRRVLESERSGRPDASQPAAVDNQTKNQVKE